MYQHFTHNRSSDHLRSDHNRSNRPNTPLKHEIFPTDISLSTASLSGDSSVPRFLASPQLRPHVILPPEDMKAAQNRKFSYASVKEDSSEDTPQSFESSLSSEDLEEVEWIAWPCSPWCRTKGLCSFHVGGTHDDYVQTRLEGYARSNPRKLEKILDEIEKRQSNRRSSDTQISPAVDKFRRARSSSGLESYGDQLRQILSRDASAIDEEVLTDDSQDILTHTHAPVGTQLSALERMPAEILDQILSYVQTDPTADVYSRQTVDLVMCSKQSRTLHAAAVRVMYRHVSISQSKGFMKFLRSLAEDPFLGFMVHWLDFSHYSNMGYGRARTTSTQTPFLTPKTIRECLDRVPNLQAFLVHEHIDDELDVKVISKLFRMNHLQSLDFTACSSRSFNEAFTTVCTLMPWRDNSMISLGSFGHPLKRLSLHECTALQEPVFEALLPRLTNLTHLDVAHTLINDDALNSIPATAQITHLNLERCTRLTGSGVVRFLTSHPAAKDTVVYLNLMADASRHRLLSEEDVSRLLPKLPSTLRSLNLGGARINPVHVLQIQRLATQLEELGLKGADIGLGADIVRILGLEENSTSRSSLRYIDLTDIKSVTQMSLAYSPISLTGPESLPLEVIEVGSSVLDDLNKRNKRIKNPDWIVRELGRRGWYVRQPTTTTTTTTTSDFSEKPTVDDDGSRPWKMGARWWGMRKIPVVTQDVGGMYGYFMFKRN